MILNSNVLKKDTLNIQIEKWHSRKTIGFRAIVSGNDTSSTLTIQNLYFYRKNSCNKKQDFYKKKLKSKIEKKFIKKLK